MLSPNKKKNFETHPKHFFLVINRFCNNVRKKFYIKNGLDCIFESTKAYSVVEDPFLHSVRDIASLTSRADMFPSVFLFLEKSFKKVCA